MIRLIPTSWVSVRAPIPRPKYNYWIAWKEHSRGMISSWKNGLVFELSLGNAEKIDLPITVASAIRCTITLHLDTLQPVAASLLIASSLHFVLSHIFIPVSERHSVNMISSGTSVAGDFIQERNFGCLA